MLGKAPSSIHDTEACSAGCVNLQQNLGQQEAGWIWDKEARGNRSQEFRDTLCASEQLHLKCL
jgi:hypothetical protein